MRLPWSQLEALLSAHADNLAARRIDVQGYASEWDDLLSFAGWSQGDLVAEIDERWSLRGVTAKPVPSS